MNKTNHLAAEVQELVCALVDGQATDGQIGRLEELLLENDQARRIYVTCMQMHADLQSLLGGKPTPPLPKVDLPPTAAGATLSGGC